MESVLRVILYFILIETCFVHVNVIMESLVYGRDCFMTDINNIL